MPRPLLSSATLRVIINPFAAPLDENGRPCAIVNYDPEHTGKPGSVRRIGCTIERKLDDVRERGKWKGQKPGTSAPAQYKRFNTKVLYDLSPQPIVDSLYHRKLVQDGALLAADDPTAKLCDVEARAPGEGLAASAAERLQDWIYDRDGAVPDVGSWLLKNWPGGEVALLEAEKRAVAWATKAIEARADRLANRATGEAGSAPPASVEAPQDVLREAQPGEVLHEMPPTPYPANAKPLEPLSGEKEGPGNPALLQPQERVRRFDTSGGAR